MHYLVTGGAGFIGSHLSEALLAQGQKVTILDDLSTGSLENIRHLHTNERFTKVVGSVLNSQLLSEAMAGCDVVVHLAAAVGVHLILDQPIQTMVTNQRGTEVVLEAAMKQGATVLLASTSEVYGKSKCPFHETASLSIGAPSTGRWGYACTKAHCEFLALAYHRERGLPVVVCRLFNTVGPRQTGRYGMVLPRFVQQALTQRPITVYGDGSQSRSFTHVSDCVRAMVALSQHKDALGQIFNIGSTAEITIRDLAYLVKEIAQSSSPIVTIPHVEAYGHDVDDVQRRLPDLSRIESLIRYKPQHNIRSIVGEVVSTMEPHEHR